MDSILNYSENDFPSLGSSVGGKSRKRHQIQSPVAHQNTAENKLTGQPAPRGYNEETTAVCSASGSSSQCQQKLSDTRRPKPTTSVTLGDFLMNPEKPCPKSLVRKTKHSEYPRLSGNPLDTDSPIRRKGFGNLPKKSKNPTKIKTAVLEGREELAKIRNYSADISVETNDVLLRSEIPEDYLWKSVVFGKVKDLKNVINFGESPVQNENDQSSHENEIPDESTSLTKDKEYNYRVSLQQLLECSQIPPHKILIHHHNFKSYCNNCVTEELNRSCAALISQLVRYQYNKYQINPTKAVANKRYVVGFKQVTKYVKLNKIKLFIIVPDMEESLSNTVEELKFLANAYCIPYTFALSRRKLGFLTYKKVGVCCFGILDYSGAERKLNKTLESVAKAKKYYEDKCSIAKKFYDSRFASTSEADSSSCLIFDTMIQEFNESLSHDEGTDEGSNNVAASE